MIFVSLSSSFSLTDFSLLSKNASSFALHGFISLFSLKREERDFATVSNSSLAFFFSRFSVVSWAIEALALFSDSIDRSSTMKA